MFSGSTARIASLSTRLEGDSIKEAVAKMGMKKNEIAVVGDQIYTDVLGANLMNLKMLYVVPIEKEKTAFFIFKRKMEKPFLPKKFVK